MLSACARTFRRWTPIDRGHSSERLDRDEGRLYDTASAALWASPLVDITLDAAVPIFAETTWTGVPDGRPTSWAERATEATTLAAMATRTARVTSRQIRSGYGPEAQAGIRRMQEISGHAQSVAHDESGQYAAGWIKGRKHVPSHDDGSMVLPRTSSVGRCHRA